MNKSDSSDSVGQSADLRTRIAAVIYRLDAEQQGYEAGRSVCSPWSLKVADAVIRELGLVQAHATEDRGGSTRKVTRYVTDWTADE